METSRLAVAAAGAGAGRIELCRDLSCGGLTPRSRDMVLAAKLVRVPLVGLVRHRAGGFVYGSEDLMALLADIASVKACRLGGVAVGALTEDGAVDAEAMEGLVAAARPLEVVFHRAFDEVAAPLDALEDLVRLGVDRVLTSGGRGDAADHLAALAELVEAADGRLTVMPGGGLRADNAARIIEATGAREIHSSGGGTAEGLTALAAVV